MKEIFVFVGVEILYGIYCELPDELDASFRVYVDFFLNVDIDLIQGLDSNELRYIDDDFLDEWGLRFMAALHQLEKFIDVFLRQGFLHILCSDA